MPHPTRTARHHVALTVTDLDASIAWSNQETRTGLDHVGLIVSSRADLETWRAHLKEMGVARAASSDRPCTQSLINDRPYGLVLVFCDPDNIQVEMFAPPSV